MIDFEAELLRFTSQVQSVPIGLKSLAALYRKAKALSRGSAKTEPLMALYERLLMEQEKINNWNGDGEDYPIELDAAITDTIVSIATILPALQEKLREEQGGSIELPSIGKIFEGAAIYYANLE